MKGIEMLKKYLREFMAQPPGLSVTPLLEAGLIYAGGPNNAWALTELGVEMLNGEGAESVEDVVNRPAHYTKGGIECIDAIRAALGPDRRPAHDHEPRAAAPVHPRGVASGARVGG